MQTEYLITFSASANICATVDKFKSLLMMHSKISIEKSHINYCSSKFSYQIAHGILSDSSIYYDLTIKNGDNDIDKYSELLRDIRTICIKANDNKPLIILHDGIGEYYCQQAYPIIYKTENLLRKLISKFMAISIGGHDWSSKATPDEVLESVRLGKGNVDHTNLLQQVDFIQLANFLFKPYTRADTNKFINSLKKKQDDEIIKVGEIRYLTSSTNWEKYFSQRVQCESEYLNSRWKKLYEYRCTIAHCRGLQKQDFDDLIIISNEVCEKFESALNSVNDIHIESSDLEELAENLSEQSNPETSDLIAKYNLLSQAVQNACDKSSSDDDVYKKYPVNKTNLLMQAKYLWNAKGLISQEESEWIKHAQAFKVSIVNNFGLTQINSSELTEHIARIDSMTRKILSVPEERLSELRGVDLRHQSQ